MDMCCKPATGNKQGQVLQSPVQVQSVRDHLIEDLAYEKLEELFGDPPFIQALLLQAPTDERHPERLL